MGTTIDEYNAVKEYHACVETIIDRLWTESVKYQMMQSDYETRLKADMVAMLTELQMDIEECVDGGEGSPLFEQGVDIARCQVVDMIQQRISALKGVEDWNVD